MMMDITVCVTPVMMYKTGVGASARHLKLSFSGKLAGYLVGVRQQQQQQYGSYHGYAQQQQQQQHAAQQGGLDASMADIPLS
ncbi:hypothetical protein FOA52_006574 [Chlamydomonas sp. UWO 241]|nr:hypothetical protein FOA52_006574 [Chlamydomonas sp. UWO 241]